jgi:hypothetical protein
MTALLAKAGHAAASNTSWPEAICFVAFCAVIAVAFWVIFR